jgi:phosphoglucosamine mutase
MVRKYFGTDGIRGRVNQGKMTPEMALRLGLAAGRYFIRGHSGDRVVIGKDTRRSGYMFEQALTAGFVAAGMEVFQVGPMPTPAIAMLTRSMRADLGVMISASHNPHYDNGIKLFGPDGFKLSDTVELEIEKLMDSSLGKYLQPSETLGKARRIDDVAGRYIEFAKSTFPTDMTLEGIKIVIDCAHGAAYKVAPIVLQELGAEVIPIGVSPNGYNINDGYGSTAPEAMCALVVAEGADIGIALDGDADRILMCDENGTVIDGDQIMALIARSWKSRDLLKNNSVVSTVMSNLGLERLLAEDGIDLIRTAVGDRYVVEQMRKNGCNVGGEQSGHIILSDFITTGDGLIAGLQVLVEVIKRQCKVSVACDQFKPVPQLLKNVTFKVKDPLNYAAVKEAIAVGEGRLNGSGRLLIRKSGTEDVMRVMAEGDDEAIVNQVVNNICKVITEVA